MILNALDFQDNVNDINTSATSNEYEIALELKQKREVKAQPQVVIKEKKKQLSKIATPPVRRMRTRRSKRNYNDMNPPSSSSIKTLVLNH